MDLQQVKKNFESRGFHVSLFDTAKEAADYLTSQIKDKTVGFGGSLTLQELGIYDRLKESNTVYWHWVDGEGARFPAATTNVYLTSANGLSENGEVINIDGSGNRTASTLFNHDTLYIVCGTNKLAPDYDAAMYRARNIAAPLNAKRLNRDTPCAKNTGEMRCFDCNSKDRICRGVASLWYKPSSIRHAEIVLINESLGY